MAEAGRGYAGDRALARLLRRHRVRLPVPAVKDLVRGVVASAAGGDETWLRLVAPRPDAELKTLLLALRDRLAEERNPAAASRPEVKARLLLLRAELARRRLSGFLVPRADEHQGEFVAACALRLVWLTGFTGSAGLAVVLLRKAALFVDGRYTLQVREETDTRLFAPNHLTLDPPEEWIARHLPRGGRLGYDPWLHTPASVERFGKAAAEAGGRLVAQPSNPLDAVWRDRPPPPLAPVVPHPVRVAGKGAAGKRREAGARLARERLAAAVLSAPDGIAWLLNLRGADVPFAPLPLAFAVLHRTGRVELFVDPRKLLPETRRHLGKGVTVLPPRALASALDRLSRKKARVRVDEGTSPAWIADRLARAGARVDRGADPSALLKAVKNPVELRGMREAHLRDGVALARFLAWLDRRAGREPLTETGAANALAAFRAENEGYRGLSFPTISAAGPDGAVVHYRPTEASDRALRRGTLYLVDSGAQYVDGTTDVTRTVAVGPPSREARDRFTRVLKGHIAVAQARFPAGTTGAELDPLAREALWRAGLDYDHGTGHGVGSYLGVHEGPQRIARQGGGVPLAPGMVLSDEPGYYKRGRYGIRIENLLLVVPLPRPPGGERRLFGFETLTLAPIDLALVEPGLLTEEEIAWLDAYHGEVRRRLSPHLDAGTRRWLARATRPLAR